MASSPCRAQLTPTEQVTCIGVAPSQYGASISGLNSAARSASPGRPGHTTSSSSPP